MQVLVVDTPPRRTVCREAPPHLYAPTTSTTTQKLADLQDVELFEDLEEDSSDDIEEMFVADGLHRRNKAKFFMREAAPVAHLQELYIF